jgi:GH25 family lysozyme M1 (1,4-beta-N-acetylmuramidase)
MKQQLLNNIISQLDNSIESLEFDLKFIKIALDYRQKYKKIEILDETEIRNIHSEKVFMKNVQKSLMEKNIVLQYIKKEQLIFADEVNYEMLKELVFLP